MLQIRVLKGKYFPHCDFIKATKKKNYSHTWRAILHGREGLLKGLIKRVGNGTNTRVWDDPWIPSKTGYKPLFRSAHATVVHASELLNEDATSWNVNAVKANFSEVDVQAICSIPCGKFAKDFWAWGAEKHGNFFVWSAYRLLRTNQPDASLSSSIGAADPIWKTLWILPAPPKVKTFWWRVIHNFIPCREVLHKRHIERIPFCVDCGVDSESAWHALLVCGWAQMFWNEVKYLTGIKIPKLHPMSWAPNLIDGNLLPEKDSCMVPCGMWAIWKARNDRRHGNINLPIIKAVQWALDTAFDVWNASINFSKTNKPKLQVHWRPLDDGLIKINVDSTFNAAACEGATGAIARDHLGKFLVAEASWQTHVASALAMEAYAAHNGVVLVRDHGFHRIIIETDSHVLSKL
ncbi:unnamed protein product [Alopecurus aequalis]